MRVDGSGGLGDCRSGDEMKTLSIFLLLFFVFGSASLAQEPAAKDADSDDVSGMYAFLQEGEFVQVNVEDPTHVTGFISRYGDTDADKGTFLDQMFASGELKGNHLHFKTRVIHGVAYEFTGTVERGTGKTAADEGYRVLRGKLTLVTEDEGNKTATKSRDVTLKSFPEDAVVGHSKKD
jgi:hypothetical protein